MALLASSRSLHASRGAVCAAQRAVTGRRTAVRAYASSATPIHIAGISGSLRKASTNTGLLRAAMRNLPPGVTMEIIDLNGLPTYNDDLYTNPANDKDDSMLPEAIRVFRQKVMKADAILFACPEYNGNVTSALKAAIDWGYNPHGPNIFADKAAGVMGAGGASGTAKGQTALKMCTIGVHWDINPDALVKRYELAGGFDDKTGDLLDKKTEGYVKKRTENLVGWARKLKAVNLTGAGAQQT